MNVVNILEDKGIHYLPKGSDYLVSCLNPEHADRNPSMRIDQITGIFNCFSCGFKGNLFNHFGERANQLQMRREMFKRKLIQKRSESVGLSFPQNRLPYVGNWRSIRPETYRKFEAFQHPDSDYVGRIVFPIRDIAGRIVAFQGRHTGDGMPKYKFTPPGAKLPFFPVVELIRSSVILVEGIFDMINLHDKGLTNAICCFGTKNIDIEKLSILKMQNIEAVDIMFDGDNAGQEAAEDLKVMAEKVGLISRNINLGSNIDPGGLALAKVSSLRDRLYG